MASIRNITDFGVRRCRNTKPLPVPAPRKRSLLGHSEQNRTLPPWTFSLLSRLHKQHWCLGGGLVGAPQVGLGQLPAATRPYKTYGLPRNTQGLSPSVVRACLITVPAPTHKASWGSYSGPTTCQRSDATALCLSACSERTRPCSVQSSCTRQPPLKHPALNYMDSLKVPGDEL